MRIDIHVHTSEHSADAGLPAVQIVDRAIRAGLDGIIFTDHDYCWTDDEIRSLRRDVPESFLILSGAEKMFPELHLLLYGIPGGPLPELGTATEYSRYAGQLGGFTVVAHPFSPARRLPASILLNCGAMGLEAYNGRRNTFELRNVLEARSLGLAELGGSDFHGWGSERLGVAATICMAGTRSSSDLCQQVMRRTTRAWRHIL